MADAARGPHQEFALIDPGVRTQLRATDLILPAVLIGLLVAFTVRYGNTWTPRGIVTAAALVVTTATLVASNVLLLRRRDVLGLIFFAFGVDALAITLVFVSPASHVAVATFPLLGCAAMLGLPDGRLLLRGFVLSWGLAVAIVVWGQTHEDAPSLMPLAPSRVAHAVTFAAAAALLLSVVFSFRERLTRATGELRADVARRAKTEEALRDSIERLKEAQSRQRLLLTRLVSAEEAERQRIAAGLHDDPVQKLTAALLRLDRARADPSKEAAMDQIEQLMRGSLQSLRHLMFELRPRSLDQRGLAAAVAELIDSYGDDLPPCDLESTLQAEPPEEIRTLLFRVIAEALANVRKHARATRVHVRLEERDGGILAVITDDGVGMDPDVREEGRSGHFGIPTMRERAEGAGGWVRLADTVSGGTSVEAWLPLRTSTGS